MRIAERSYDAPTLEYLALAAKDTQGTIKDQTMEPGVCGRMFSTSQMRNRTTMKPGKRTAKLIREAMILGYVNGAWDAGGLPDGYPKDSEIVRGVLRSARSNRDLYPTLSQVEDAEGTS